MWGALIRLIWGHLAHKIDEIRLNLLDFSGPLLMTNGLACFLPSEKGNFLFIFSGCQSFVWTPATLGFAGFGFGLAGVLMTILCGIEGHFSAKRMQDLML